MRRLRVYINDTPAGMLTEHSPGHGYEFRYDKDYVATGRTPVSVTLPLREAPYESELLFPFFINMIPEGANRKMVCRNLKIDENDFFGILDAFSGKDVIGSVNVRRPVE